MYMIYNMYRYLNHAVWKPQDEALPAQVSLGRQLGRSSRGGDQKTGSSQVVTGGDQIWSNYSDRTQPGPTNGGLVREMPGNLGW